MLSAPQFSFPERFQRGSFRRAFGSEPLNAVDRVRIDIVARAKDALVGQFRREPVQGVFLGGVFWVAEFTKIAPVSLNPMMAGGLWWCA